MGPLQGIRVVELAGIGPGPFCGMLLADMGADVLRIDRRDGGDGGVRIPPRLDLLNRNKRSVSVDLKSVQGRETVLRLVEKADILIEGYRPGVTERLGLGPTDCQARNPRLVYGRMTGWGQDGPLAQMAGHDLNYIALSGALHAIGPQDGPPQVPLNLIGDFGGGALYLALGVLAATLEARNSGQGQVVDAAMVDGVASLMTLCHSLRQMGQWNLERGDNLFDGGAPFYAIYETSDGRHVSVAAVEPRFYAILLDKLGLAGEALPGQYDRAGWPRLRERLAQVFRSRSRDQWSELFGTADACFAPVLDLDEAREHPLARERGMYCERDGVFQPMPAPRFSRTPGGVRLSPPEPGQHGQDALRDWGVTPG
ncbi:TPA: CoA transferase [Pseudomonas aeruginosa]|nr:CoA transferase [Pseudomonas aeruginosa]